MGQENLRDSKTMEMCQKKNRPASNLQLGDSRNEVKQTTPNQKTLEIIYIKTGYLGVFGL